MLTRHLKLKLFKAQETQLNEWLWYLTGVYNWAIKQIEINAGVKKFKVDEKIKKEKGILNGLYGQVHKPVKFHNHSFN